MPSVTVLGAQNEVITLNFDSAPPAIGPSRYDLASIIANAINTGVSANSITAADNRFGAAPALPSGAIGEFVQSKSAVTNLPGQYNYVVVPGSVVDSTSAAIGTANPGGVLFGNGAPNQQILIGDGNFTYNAGGLVSGAGTIVGGNGNDQVIIPATDAGNWYIALGNGNNTIKALGAGADTVVTGTGNNTIRSGAGGSLLAALAGNDTVSAGGSAVVYGGQTLHFVGGGGSTVYGGTGSDTIYGGTGPSFFQGGSGGNNLIYAGTSTATVYGGGNGDRLFAQGSAAQILFASTGAATLAAAAGNDSLIGGTGTNTYVAGTGDSTVDAAGTAGADIFNFSYLGVTGRTQTVGDLADPNDLDINLFGYSNVAPTQDASGGQLVMTLSDGTKITFLDINTTIDSSKIHFFP